MLHCWQDLSTGLSFLFLLLLQFFLHPRKLTVLTRSQSDNKSNQVTFSSSSSSSSSSYYYYYYYYYYLHPHKLTVLPRSLSDNKYTQVTFSSSSSSFCTVFFHPRKLTLLSSSSHNPARVPGPRFGFVKLLASSGSHCTKWADEQHRPAGFESRIVPDLPLPFIPTLIGLRAFDLVSSRVWWEAATNSPRKLTILLRSLSDNTSPLVSLSSSSSSSSYYYYYYYYYYYLACFYIMLPLIHDTHIVTLLMLVNSFSSVLKNRKTLCT